MVFFNVRAHLFGELRRRLDEEKVLATAWPNSRPSLTQTAKQTKCDTSKSKSISHRTLWHRFSTVKATPSFWLAAPKKHVYRDGSLVTRTKGWVHAEYSLLPGSTDSRFRRERRGAKGRTQEIERLVARSLRAAVDLEALGPVALNVDCDVLNADGGTRCASITAANIALRLAVRRLIARGQCLPLDMRPTEDQRKAGWTAPTLSETEKSKPRECSHSS